MADIFISYASADREMARTLGQALAAKGYDTWWDRTIPPGRVFDEVIQEALAAAKCVVVLWSQASVASNWVKTEAAEAAGRNMLVPVMVENVLPPIEFKRIQSANLAAWDGNQNDPEFSNLVASVDRLLAGAQSSKDGSVRKVAANTGWGRQANSPGSSYKWATVAAVVLLLLGAGAWWVYQQGMNAGKGTADGGMASRESQAKPLTRGGGEPVNSQQPSSPAEPLAKKIAPSTVPAGRNNAAATVGQHINLLSSENGGQLVAAASEAWSHLIDGKDKEYANLTIGQSGVFAFKDERPATFDMFKILIPATSDYNIRAFELLKGNDSPTGKFESIGSFETQDLKLFKTPYQEFPFAPVTAKYLKVKILSTWKEGYPVTAYQFALMGAVK